LAGFYSTTAAVNSYKLTALSRQHSPQCYRINCVQETAEFCVVTI